MQRLARSLWALVLAGAVLLFLSQMRFGLGALAWVAPIPWLHALRLATTRRQSLAILGAMVATWVAATFKIVTEPLPPLAAIAFGIPIGTTLAAPYAAWAFARSRSSDVVASLVLACSVVIAEWLLHAVMPFGSWGSVANTQLDQLALLQLASVTGVHGIAFLVSFVSASGEALWHEPTVSTRRIFAASLAAVGLVVVLGQARLAIASAAPAANVRVATVDTDATFAGPPLPSAETIARIDAVLEARTHAAAASGAVLVVWPEASTMTRPDEEAAFLEHLGEIARTEHVRLAVGYVVPMDGVPFRFRNSLAMVAPDGTIDGVYLKHHPVPGEPAITGEGPMPLAHDARLGAVSGALCYDYDFPRLGLAQAALGTDVVALPASDWRGIDPIHADMVIARAIEDGVSVVRATRLGSSIVVDPYGRVRARHSAFDGAPFGIVSDVPQHGVRTIYARLGDWLVVLAALFLVGAASRSLIRRDGTRPASLRSSDETPA